MGFYVKKIKYYTKFEKFLALFVLFFAGLSLVLFIVLLTKSNGTKLCTTPQCVDAANQILSLVDTNVNPCDDFYQFSCGKFLRSHLQRTAADLMGELSVKSKTYLKNLVTQNFVSEKGLPKSFRYQRQFYRMCLNQTAIENDKDKTFLDALDYVCGGWPLATGFAMPIRWLEVMVKARKVGMKYDFFLNVDIRTDPDENTIYLKIGLPPKYNFDKDIWREDNIPKFLAIASIWGSPAHGAKAELKKTMDFEKSLQKIVDKAYDALVNVTLKDQKSTIGELKKFQLVRLHWLDFLKNITELDYLTEDTVIVVSITQDYFKDLYYLLQQTEYRILGNYIAMLQIMNEYTYLSSKVSTLGREIDNRQYRQSREDYCYQQAQMIFDSVAEGVYIRQMVTESKKAAIKELLENVKQELLDTLKKNTWMDNETKSKALEHLQGVKDAIGWTSAVFNVEEYEKLSGYHLLNVRFSNITSVNHQLSKFHYDFRFKKLGSLSEFLLSLLSRPAIDVNAYFFKQMNTLVLAASILQPPIFDRDRPNYMNYGLLGSIIGHELTHAFSKFDVDDTLPVNDTSNFWQNASLLAFDNASRCVVEEYENYDGHLKEFSSNGSVTLQENIADFTGAHLAYQAYQKRTTKHGPEPNLPGVNFSPNQIFWIMSSGYFCFNPNLKFERTCRNNIHGVPSFRVIGTLRNSPYFARDFNCPIGSRMNPAKKCRVFV